MLKFAVTHSLVLGVLLAVAGLWLGPVRLPRDLVIIAVVAGVVLIAVGMGHGQVRDATRRLKGVPRSWEFPAMLTASVLLTSVQAFMVLFLDFGPALPLFLLPLVCLLTSLLGLTVLASLRNRHRLAVALAPAVAVSLLLSGVWWVMAEQERERRREGIVRAFDEPPVPIAVLDAPGWKPSDVWIDGGLPATAVDYVPVDSSFEPDGFGLTLRVEPAVPEEETGWAPLYKGCLTEGGTAECEVRGDGGVVVATSASGDVISSLQARVEVADGMIATLTTNMPDDARDDPFVEFPDIDMAALAEHVRTAGPEDAEEVAAAVTD